MLVLVLEHHPVHVSILQQWSRGVEVRCRQPGEYPLPDALHHLDGVGQSRQRQLAPFLARMFEGIVEPGHLHKLDRPVQIPGEPQLLEMGDMPEVPQQRAHQGVVLDSQVFIRQGGKKQQRAGSGFFELLRDCLAVNPAGKGYRRHR